MRAAVTAKEKTGFLHILAIINVYMRLIVNYYIGLKYTGKELVFTLNMEFYNTGRIHGALKNMTP